MPGRLTEEELDQIADRAAEKVIQIMYAEVGKSVIKRLLWLVAAITAGVYSYLKIKGGA